MSAVSHICKTPLPPLRSGMTGTLSFHSTLVREFHLLRRIELPNWPGMRAELFCFKRKTPQEMQRSAGRQSDHCHMELLACDWCGRNNVPLWRCPWSRQYHVCSNKCYENSASSHHAVLAACFCGVHTSHRPPLSEWDVCEWLEAPTSARRAGEASEKKWLALAAATPQAEA